MAGPIQSPVKGQPMRASWGAAVSSAVNSLLPMGSDGLLARQGVAGTGFAPLPANLRDRRAAAAAKTPGRFEILSITPGEPPEEGEEQSLTVTFANPYYDVGGRTYEMSKDETLDPPAVALQLESTDRIIALKVKATGDSPVAELVGYAGLSALQADQGDYDFFIRPLYILNAAQGIACDLRTGPSIDMGEFKS